MPPEDRVDFILRQWSRERPDLDVAPMAVIGRLMRVSRHLDRELATVYKTLDLDFGLFDVLATLRRSGEPYRLSPRELKQWCMLTSGAMTARIARLQAAGYVVREPDPDDRRGLLVRLSPAGFALIDDLIAAHLENEERILDALSPEERSVLTSVLRRLLIPLEQTGQYGLI